MLILIIILVSLTLYWILYYRIEGEHDSFVVKNENYLRSIIYEGRVPYSESIMKSNSRNWHKLDGNEKAVTKILIGVMFGYILYNLTNEVMYSIVMALLEIIYSVCIRIIFHDGFFNIYMGYNWDRVGVSNSNKWDIFLRKMRDEKGIPPIIFRLVPLVLTVITIIVWIIINRG